MRQKEKKWGKKKKLSAELYRELADITDRAKERTRVKTS